MTSLSQWALGRGSLWLTVIRDAFVVLLPLTFLGLTALLVQFFPWSVFREAMTVVWGVGWPIHLGLIIKATHGIFGMVLAPVVATFLARLLLRPSFDMPEIPSVIVGIAALINFMLMASARPSFMEGLGYVSMLQGIAVGIGTAELVQLTVRCRWLRMSDKHDSGDATYHHAIQMTPAVIVSGFTMFFVAQLIATLPTVSPHVLSPLVSWAQTQQVDAVWILSSIAVLLSQMAWFLGIPGAQLLDTYGSALFAPGGSAYTNALAWRPLFNHFILVGGAGTTLCLAIAILMTVRQGHQNRVAKLSIVPALFNINEAILYGLPLVLNSLYLIPFLCVPLLLSLITVVAAQIGFVAFLPIDIPWTTPPLWSGWLLTGSWRGVALQLVEIGLGVAIYLPFVRAAEAARTQRESQMVSAGMQQIAEESQAHGKYVIRRDQNGLIARNLLADLRAAFSANDGALRLAYQPKHDKAGSIVGVEALIRWNHPLYGPISPVVIIALTENGDDIHQLGAWVMAQACACKARWNEAGHQALTMAINLSPLQLEDFKLTSNLERLLRQHGLQPSEIELEITESAAIADSRAVDQTLRRLVEMQVRLSMDDFGMGYSSLLYLRRFHVHSIKIDGSLTRDVLTNNTNADIIRAIVALGRSQKVDVVAEYVENLEQRVMLTDLGCDIFQGHHHSPALPEAQCLTYFEKNQTVAVGHSAAYLPCPYVATIQTSKAAA